VKAHIWLSIFWVSFLLPFHAYPFPDLWNDLAGICVATVLFFLVAVQAKGRIVLPKFAFLLLALIAVVVFSAINQQAPRYTDYSYSMFLLSGLLVLISSSNLKYKNEVLINRLALSLLCIALVTSFYGILRHYGVLKHLLPWVVTDGDRLLGPLNQANLTALVLALGVTATCYKFVSGTLGTRSAIGLAIPLAFAASLTGSRAFIAFLFIILFVPIFKLIIEKLAGLNVELENRARYRKAVVIVLASLLVSFAAPIVDKPLSAALQGSGFLDRKSDQNILDRFSGAGYYRFEEWKKLKFAHDIIESPLLGVGPGRYGVFSIDADGAMGEPDRMGVLWIHGHNLFVNVFVELGYLGLLVVLSMLFYLIFLFVKARSTPQSLFVFVILGILLFNNLIEFSFWFFGFFALALSLVAFSDTSIKVQFTSRFVPQFLGTLILITTIGTITYVGRDAWSATLGFHKAQLTENEQYAFQNAKNNKFVGGDAFKAELIRTNPSLFGVDAQMRELEQLMSWRPEMVFMLRHTVLKTVIGPENEACMISARTVGLYPNSLERIVEELTQVKSDGATFDLDAAHDCLAAGMLYWVQRNPEFNEFSQ